MAGLSTGKPLQLRDGCICVSHFTIQGLLKWLEGFGEVSAKDDKTLNFIITKVEFVTLLDFFFFCRRTPIAEHLSVWEGDPHSLQLLEGGGGREEGTGGFSRLVKMDKRRGGTSEVQERV